MQNDEPSNDSAITGQHASAEQVFYHELGGELVKKTVPFLNDVLSKLLTISITLSGGSVFFLGEKNYPTGMKITAIGLFLIAFIMSLIGMLPYRASIRTCCPDDVQRAVAAAMAWKDGWIYGAATFIILGTIVAASGFLFA